MVKENHVVVLFADFLKHLLSAGCRVNLHLGLFQKSLEDNQVHAGVVNHENLRVGGTE